MLPSRNAGRTPATTTGWVAKRRALARAALAAAAVYAALVVTGCWNPSTPVDYLINVGCAPVDPALRLPRDGRVRLVVLQHGMWRSAGALWKLERSLEAHGYRVLNRSYPSRSARIEDHAARLHDALEQEIARLGSAPAELWFVGHSMGGVVIGSYLRREDAREPTGCVFLGVPHRGAVVAAIRRRNPIFRLLLGDRAAVQLCPEDAMHLLPPPRELGAVGTIVGCRGDAEGYSDLVPGDDDGLVSVEEARLPQERDSVALRMGHTRLTFHDDAILQVLHFLRHQRFDHEAVDGRR